jgi:hypothetical protein
MIGSSAATVGSTIDKKAPHSAIANGSRRFIFLDETSLLLPNGSLIFTSAALSAAKASRQDLVRARKYDFMT